MAGGVSAVIAPGHRGAACVARGASFALARYALSSRDVAMRGVANSYGSAMRELVVAALGLVLAASLAAQDQESARALTKKRGHRLTDEEFAKVAAVTSWTELDLSNCKGLSGAAIEKLVGMEDLRELSLANTGRALAGVEHLADLPKLRSLDLSGNKEFAGEGLHVLRDLRVLNLSNCVALKDQHMAKIAELHSLEELRLYGCHKITDKGFNRLFAGLDQLHTLELAFCWWHQGHELRLPPNLVHLDLHESKRLVDDAIIAIRNKQGLRTLNLFQCLVLTDRSLDALKGLTELEWLDVGSIRALTDAGLAHVATLSGLAHLSLCDNANFTGQGVAQLATLRGLKELNLWHCEALTDVGLRACAAMPQLQRLNLASCALVGDAGLRELRGLKQLRELHLDGCQGVTAAGLARITDLELLELTLMRCEGVDDKALEVLSTMKSLRYLDVRECLQVTPAALAAMKTKLPNCEVRP